MQRPGPLIVGAVVFSVAACLTGCKQGGRDTPPEVNRPLPAPPSGELKYAGTPPAHPYAKQGDHYARVMFETDGPGNSHIEIRDVLIPPHSKSTVEALPGPAVLDPASAGNVTLSTGAKSEALSAGGFRSLEAGQTLALENPDPRPVTVRLYIIRSR